MTNSTAHDVAALLEEQEVATIGVDLFVDEWGIDSTNLQVLIMNTGGFESNEKLIYERPNFQILVRGERNGSSKIVYDLIKSIYVFLMEQPPLININGTDYLGFDPTSNIAGLGRDENQRYIYTSNYTTFRNYN